MCSAMALLEQGGSSIWPHCGHFQPDPFWVSVTQWGHHGLHSEGADFSCSWLSDMLFITAQWTTLKVSSFSSYVLYNSTIDVMRLNLLLASWSRHTSQISSPFHLPLFSHSASLSILLFTPHGSSCTASIQQLYYAIRCPGYQHGKNKLFSFFFLN